MMVRIHLWKPNAFVMELVYVSDSKSEFCGFESHRRHQRIIMATRNDITGDEIKSKGPSKAYLDNYDLIWGKKKEEKPSEDEIDIDPEDPDK